jgi:putative transposase
VVAQRHHSLLERRRELKAEHPFWGYRRMWAYRRVVEQQPVNTKRIWRLRREPHLLVQPTMQVKAKRTPTGRQPSPPKPNAWWGIEMPQV